MINLKIKKSIKVLVITILVMSTACASVFAYITFNNNTIIGGVANLKYTFAYDLPTGYNYAVSSAAGDWNYNGYTNAIRFSEDSSGYGQIGINSVNQTAYEWQDTLGATTYSNGNPMNGNWTSCTVYINRAYCPSYGTINAGGYTYTTEDTRITVSHEFGHVMGLNHVGNSRLLMYPYHQSREVTRPQQNDVDGVKFLYGF